MKQIGLGHLMIRLLDQPTILQLGEFDDVTFFLLI
jgi:hypothetical protein